MNNLPRWCGSGARSGLVALVALLYLVVAPSAADAHPWQQGSVRISLGGGMSSSGEDTTFILGGGVGYNIIDGLELGLDVDHWFGGPLRITRLTPGTEYVLWFVPAVQPYVGAFYRRWFIRDFDNQSSVGLRGGAYFGSTGRLLVGLGVARESFIGGCNVSCTAWYPEFRLAFRF